MIFTACKTYAGVTHNDIQPENVFVYDAYSDTPHIHPVNYSNALPITYMPNSHVVLPMASSGGTVGYNPLESVIYPEVDLETPLYSYVTEGGQVHRISNRKYINTLKIAYETEKDQLKLPSIDNVAMAYFADLRPLAIRHLTIDLIYRTRLL